MNPTKIEYVDVSWSPIAMRCTPVSPGCANCWHLEMCGRFAKNPKIPAHLRAVYAGNAPPMLIESRLQQPLEDKTPRTIATQFMGDLFHDDITVAMLRKIFAVMREAAWHTFYVLTKRPIGMLAVSEHLGYWPENAWAGVTVENQKAADERIPVLMKVPAAIRWVSLEPMLDAIDIEHHLSPNPVCDGCGWVGPSETEGSDHVRNAMEPGDSPERCGTWRMPPSLDWVVAGSESGQGRRPSDPDWFRSLRDQCVAAGVPYFLKQMDIGGKVVPMPQLDGRVWDQKPEVEHG